MQINKPIRYVVKYLEALGIYIAEDKLYAPDDIKSFPIRQEITVLGADIPKLKRFDHGDIIISSNKRIRRNNLHYRHLKVGWTMTETIGISVVNPKAIHRYKKGK